MTSEGVKKTPSQPDGPSSPSKTTTPEGPTSPAPGSALKISQPSEFQAQETAFTPTPMTQITKPYRFISPVGR